MFNIKNVVQMSTIAASVTVIATTQARDNMVRPQGLLEHIVDFFTLGAVSREKAKEFDAFVEMLTNVLDHQVTKNAHPYLIPETLIIEYLDFTITCSQPGEVHNATGPVTIEVSKGGEKAETTVDKDIFYRISTALLLRNMGGLPATSAVLTANGRMDLREGDFYQTDLRGVDLGEADLSGADLRYAKLNRANMSGAVLIEADMQDADLSWAILRYADLKNADLRDADFSWADCRDIDLSGSKLNGPELTWAKTNKND